MNLWAFTGNLGAEAVQRYTQNGEPVLAFSVAVKSGYGKHEATTWANCQLWGKRAESLAPYLKKGTQVALTGEVTLQEYKAKDGTQKYSLSVRVGELTLLGKNKAEQNEAAAPESKPESNDAFADQDIPF